jgi:regulator of protease activity HflC (stomatin/prohibitin superfamily)
MSGCLCCICVSEASAGVVENLGKYSKVAPPGLTCVQWPLESVVATLSLRVRQIDINCQTKTKDNVFVTVVTAIQYRVVEEKVSAAYYKLTDHRAQITSYVFDVIRSTLPGMELDEAFSSKEILASNVKTRLSELMADYGYEIMAALVVDLEPDRSVKMSMNEINAASRRRVAAAEKAEAEKILQVKAAEAEAESKYLAGVGVSRQRKAIVDGLRSTVTDFSSSVEGTGPKDVMDLLLLTQYFEVLRDCNKVEGASNTLFLPHGPHAVTELKHNLKNSFAGGNK